MALQQSTSIPEIQKTIVILREMSADEKIREEAKWAMEECTTDEQREKVYEEVKSSIQKLQAALDRSGEKIITDLKAQTKDNEDDELSGSDPLIKYRSTLEKFLKDLENTKGGNGDSVLE